MTTPRASAKTYPDLPPSGPGAVAPLTRRIVALLIDWALCQLIAVGILGMQWGQVNGVESFYPLAVLFVENLLLVATLGTTLGHRLLGLKVISIDSGPGSGALPPSFGQSFMRAALLCLAIPPIIMDSRMRGLHDKAARSIVVRSR